jgi:dienelactone hydrolase
MTCMPLLLVLLFSITVSAQPDPSPIPAWLGESIVDATETQKEINRFIRARIPELALPNSPTEWESVSSDLRKRILKEIIFRGAPHEWSEWKAKAVWAGALETGKGYRIRKLRYEALPGLWIPALLYEPDSISGKVPVVLNVNGHVGVPGKAIEYEQIRCINLAKRGMLALHPEWLSFGELSGKDLSHNRQAYLDLCGRSGVSVFYLAMRGGLDVLLDIPNSDSGRVAMTGLSGGGWQTILLSALDARITAIAPNAGYIGLGLRLENRGDIGDLEQNPNDLATIADYPHLTALLAPRPALLLYNEKDQCCFQSDRARNSVFEPIIPFYGLFGKRSVFEFHSNSDPGTHNYDLDNRRQFYRFIGRHFFQGEDPREEEIDTAGEIRSATELRVGIPESNASFYSLAHELLDQIPKREIPAGRPAEVDAWRKVSCNRLRVILRSIPLDATGSLVKQTSAGGIDAAWYRLKAGEDWTVSGLALSKPGAKDTFIALCDNGQHGLLEDVPTWVGAGHRVVVIDPLFLGKSAPGKVRPWQYAQMIAMAGERPLGIQVDQVGAIARWACQKFAVDKVSILADGPASQVVSLCAAALYPDVIRDLHISNGLSSLKDLIEEHTDYEDCPSLFCFGLLEEFDLEQLAALKEPESGGGNPAR